MYDELIAELRQHHCDAKEDDTQEVCEECSYDVIIVDKSAPSGIASVCVCGLMHKAADAIEELRAKADLHKEVAEEYRRVNMMLIDKFPQWIPVSERLPKEEETVLTWGKENQCILLDWMHDNKWCCFGGADYWMPLPEPPEKESES